MWYRDGRMCMSIQARAREEEQAGGYTQVHTLWGCSHPEW